MTKQNLLKLIRQNWLAILIIFLISVIYIIFEVQGYRNFQFPVLDLGMYNRHMWSLVRFDFSANPLKGYNLLGDHAHFILFFFIPIYALFQNPLTLTIIHVLCITLSGTPIYLIAKNYFKNNYISALWLIPYFFYFGFISALAYPFHVATLAVLPLSFALYYLLEKKYFALIVALFLLTITKENMPLTVIMFGLYILIIQRKYFLGSTLIFLATIYFTLITRYFMPKLSHLSYYYQNTENMGNNFLEIIKNSLTKPLAFIKSMLLPRTKFDSIRLMLQSFGFFSFLGLEIFILISPMWIARFLSPLPWRWGLTMHYSTDQGPILMVAAIIGVSRLSNFNLLKKYKNIILVLALIWISLLSYFVNFRVYPHNPILRLTQKNFYTQDQTEHSAWEAINLIPKNSSVAVQSAFPQLTSRRNVYNLPTDLKESRPEYILTSKNLDFWPFKNTKDLESYINDSKNLDYREIYNQNDVILLKAN